MELSQNDMQGSGNARGAGGDRIKGCLLITENFVVRSSYMKMIISASVFLGQFCGKVRFLQILEFSFD